MEWDKVIFLSYLKEDEEKVRHFYDELKAEGFEPWFDKENLQYGGIWKPKILEAIKKSRRFIACISNAFYSRETGYFNKEWKYAFEILEQKKPESTYFTPVLLEDVSIPDYGVPNGLEIKDFHAAKLFDPEDKRKLFNQLKEELYPSIKNFGK